MGKVEIGMSIKEYFGYALDQQFGRFLNYLLFKLLSLFFLRQRTIQDLIDSLID